MVTIIIITSILNVMTYIITSIAARPIELTVILVIMYVKTSKTVVIL